MLTRPPKTTQPKKVNDPSIFGVLSFRRVIHPPVAALALYTVHIDHNAAYSNDKYHACGPVEPRHNQHWNRAGIDGINRQIDQTTRTTSPPCQQARHIVVAQVSSRMFMDDLPFAAGSIGV
jgi:hypothetical protein